MRPFVPQTVDLPDAWPPCRTSRCGSTLARARVDVPYGPVAVTCENGHVRGYRKKDDFRTGGRYADAFAASALAPDVPRGAAERLVDPGERRRTEVLEDADRCALCGTPPAQHPLRPDDDLRTDREIAAWLQRWRPDVFADLVDALAVARASGAVNAWRLALAPNVRERVVDALRESALTTDHVLPPAHLIAVAEALPKRDLAFAVNGLLIAVCERCAHRRHAPHDVHAAMRAYVDALYAGDETAARADTSRWRTMEKLARTVARAHASSAQRSA